MINTRFWLASKAQLQFISELQIHDHELVCISFSPSRASCQVSVDCFVRIARQRGVKTLRFSQWGPDQPYFNFIGIEFVCICSQAKRAEMATEFQMECVDEHLQEAGF